SCMRTMFSGCRGVATIDVRGFDTSNVTSMSLMFSDCSGLASIDVRGFDTSNVANMRNMFSGCRSLKSVDLSGFETYSVTEMGWMLSDCSSLVNVDLSAFNICNDTSMVGMLSGCNNLIKINSPINVKTSVALPTPMFSSITWSMPDGAVVTELPQNLDYSVTLTRSDALTTPKIITTTDDLNMADVIRVKYVPYSYTVATDNTDTENTVTFSIAEGTLAEGLQISPTTGEIYGVPLEAGEFKVTVMATYSNPEYPPSYAELTLIILDNTDENVGGATDPGYNITQPVADFNMDTISGEGTQTLVSQGEYAQFQHIVYIDGKLLEEGEGKDYTSEAGNTRITIRNQTLADGGVGTHTLCIVFRAEDGTLKRAAQNYTVSSGSSGDDGGNDKPGDEGNGDKNPENENTDAKPPVENLPSNSEDSSNSSNSGNNSDISNNSKGDTTSIELVKNTVDAGNVTEVTYTIVSGDTLWKIADRFYGNGSLWTKIFADNADIIKDANKIYVGQVIRLYIMDQPEQASISAVPTTTSIPLGNTGQLPTDAVDGEVYVVQTGDSLWKIAAKLYGDGHKWRSIYAANQDVLRAPGKIYAGQRLIIPDK
ncbi:MAG: LysM peptidoglycan-binding domain-containing protein, partial [Acetatifactor sp.]|nr:LysM peptidoglycan-binding domain-containing protein [Acetatifactor sp.]